MNKDDLHLLVRQCVRHHKQFNLRLCVIKVQQVEELVSMGTLQYLLEDLSYLKVLVIHTHLHPNCKLYLKYLLQLYVHRLQQFNKYLYLLIIQFQVGSALNCN